MKIGMPEPGGQNKEKIKHKTNLAKLQYPMLYLAEFQLDKAKLPRHLRM